MLRRVFIAGCVAPFLLANTLQAAETVKVGSILALTGPFAAMGEAVDRGARLYIKKNVDKLPAGVSVELVTRDNAGPNPSVAKRLAQELVVREGVTYLTGAVFTPDAAAIAPLATEAKVPFILPNASTSSLTRQSPYIVRVSLTQWQLAYPMGEWAAKKGYKTAYVVVADYAAGHDTQEAFSRAFTGAGGEVKGVLRIPQNVTDFAPYMQTIKDAKPDMVFMFINSRIAALKAWDAAGLTKAGIQLMGPGDLLNDDDMPAIGAAAEGVITGGIYTSNQIDWKPSRRSTARTSPAISASPAGMRWMRSIRALQRWGPRPSPRMHSPTFRNGRAMQVRAVEFRSIPRRAISCNPSWSTRWKRPRAS